MDFENFNMEKNVRLYLHFFTNNFYSFAIASERIWTDPEKVEHMVDDKPFYQLMPDRLDDGFFDWYCFVRPNNQFFRTREVCILYFVLYWTEWFRKGKPDWKTHFLEWMDKEGGTALYPALFNIYKEALHGQEAK